MVPGRMAAILAAALALQASAGDGEAQGLATAAGRGSPAARLEAIGKLGERRAEEGLPVLRATAAAGEIELRVAAIAALGEYASAGQFPLLRDLARDADSRIAGAAVRALGRGGFAAMPFLVDALRHEAAGVREAAGAALQRISGVHAEPALLAESCIAAKGDRFAFLAAILARDAGPRATADALRALPDAPESVVPLVKELGSKYEPVRGVARARLEGLACRRMTDEEWRAWGSRPFPTIVAIRAEAWRDAGNPMRAAAARGLAVPDKAAVEALLAAPADGAAEEQALLALAVATGLRPRTRAEWSAWWQQNRERSRLEWLIAALLETGDAPNRAAAARSLGGERSRRSVEHLLSYGIRDGDPVVRGAAESALGALLGPKDQPGEDWAAVWKRSASDWR